jgi:ribosomal protein S12 methylthiotransferase accessory factor
MQTETQLPGKDASLEQTLSTARALLDRVGFPIDLVSSKNPVRNCWSVHLRSTECPQIYTNGKGGSQLASEASAILEFFERISTNLFFSDYYLGPLGSEFIFYPAEKWFPVSDAAVIPSHHPDGTRLLNDRLCAFYNPEGELVPALLHDNNSEGTDRGIAALPFTQIETNETVYFPVSLLNNLYVSNGMAAGNTVTECRAQALAEIMERSVKNRIIAEGICLPAVPDFVLARYPRIQGDIEELRGHGFPVLVKDASLGGQFPVICVLLINPTDGGCYASFGASCRFEVALERTVTELLQGRGLDQLDVFAHPSSDAAAVADPLNIESHFIDSVGLLSWKMFGDQPDYDFKDWDFKGTTADEYEHLKSLVTQNGFEAYCAEYQQCGIYTCRIIVPGMSEIYPVDELVWSNKVTGASLRPRLLLLNRLSVAELQAFAEELDELGLSDEQPISDAIGVLFAEGTAWHSLRVGELKGMLALAAGDLDEALAWCRWCSTFDFLSAARQTLYRVLCDLIELNRSGETQEDYLASLRLFYDESVLTDAIELIDGRSSFHGLTFADSWEEISPVHQKFIQMYKRLHPLKLAADV